MAMGDAKPSVLIPMPSRDRDRDLLVPPAAAAVSASSGAGADSDDDESKPSSASAAAAAAQTGREVSPPPPFLSPPSSTMVYRVRFDLGSGNARIAVGFEMLMASCVFLVSGVP